jgi:RNA:NAD 2'-phosphotransferase (TPT1/KptA family)/8-oxo-dGTP pyrophosphatase MutT (NUDIX family)
MDRYVSDDLANSFLNDILTKFNNVHCNGVIVFKNTNNGIKFAVAIKNDTHYSFLKGGYEKKKDANMLSNAIRECEEESGFKLGVNIEIVYNFFIHEDKLLKKPNRDHDTIQNGRINIGYFLGQFIGPDNYEFKFDKNELTNVEWLSYNDLKNKMFADRNRVLHDVHDFINNNVNNMKFINNDVITIIINSWPSKQTRISHSRIKPLAQSFASPPSDITLTTSVTTNDSNVNKNNNKQLIRCSKYLSKYLRHSCPNEKIDEYGWVLIKDVCDELNIPINTLKQIVETNDKNRFEFYSSYDNEILCKNDYIRALQGHSISKVNTRENKLIDPKDVGTFNPLLNCHEAIHATIIDMNDPTILKIKNDQMEKLDDNIGLSRMARNDIHMVKDLTNDRILNKKFKTLIFVNVEAAMNEGIEFYSTKNGCILSQGNNNGIIPSKCLRLEKYNLLN